MRDPARIDKVLSMLKAYWKTYPDMRLMQLIDSIVGDRDCFYMEDDEFLDKLEEAMKRFATMEG